MVSYARSVLKAVGDRVGGAVVRRLERSHEQTMRAYVHWLGSEMRTLTSQLEQFRHESTDPSTRGAYTRVIRDIAARYDAAVQHAEQTENIPHDSLFWKWLYEKRYVLKIDMNM